MKQRVLIVTGILLAVVLATTPWGPDSRAAETTAVGKGGVEKLAVEYDYASLEKKIQEVRAPVKAAAPNEASIIKNADKLSADIHMKRERNRFISIILLLIGLIASLYCVLYFINKTHCSANDIVHAAGLVLIIFGTIIIVLMIDAESQLTAAIGVMEAIAGYLFGSPSRSKEEKTVPPGNPREAGTADAPPPGRRRIIRTGRLKGHRSGSSP